MNKLKAIRAELGMNQEQFAAELGLSVTGYQMKEAEKREFTASEINKILELARRVNDKIKYEDIFLN